MLEYASNDVLYLPKIYYLIQQYCEQGMYQNLTFYTIMNQCNKYLEYSKINLSIKNFNKINIEKGKELFGLLKY